jgi:predicted CXXCH cytochrome family protein
MRLRRKAILLLIGITALCAGSLAFSQDQFRLKPGAKGKACLDCHPSFQEKMKLPFVHTPVKRGSCSDCHNPHTSSHGKLLSKEPAEICGKCHGGIVPGKAKSVHKAVAEGNCVKCHDPHAAKNRNNLLLDGSQLCFSCHKDIAESIKGVKFPHKPLEKGCLGCHNPHASAGADSLLKAGVPSLCIGCHKADSPSFAKQHLNYPVARARCTSCHDPHGSSQPGILWANVHSPVSKKMCSQCHLDSASPDALKVKRPGYELCRGCHAEMVNQTFGRNRIHWPLLDQASCQNCHNPHAARQDALLRDSMKNVCNSCHRDVARRLEASNTKHKPIQDGQCTKCHLPHSSNLVSLLDNTGTIDLCGTCHEWLKHSSHPIGDNVVDQRNKNLSVDCLSCHRSHGTEFKGFTYYNPKMDLCVQCHVTFKR